MHRPRVRLKRIADTAIPKLGLALRSNPALEAATRCLSILWGGSLKAVGFGDGFSPANLIICSCGLASLLCSSVKFLDVNIGELDGVTMMLQSDGATLGYSWKLSIANHRLAIDEHGDTVVNNGNLKTVPLAWWIIRI